MHGTMSLKILKVWLLKELIWTKLKLTVQSSVMKSYTEFNENPRHGLAAPTTSQADRQTESRSHDMRSSTFAS